ncbi:MAG TPA: FkbM family methyltransferase [Verrucomicrobiae bacterium]|nr:FkbM family methyltransferase [Verrucomicrobiae bacterium]
MRRLVTALSHSAIARRAVQAIRLHKLANGWLRRFPLVKRLPGSGVIYRATRLESIPLANEMFERGNLYDAHVVPENFTTFADLGCNVGYFTCWLAHLAKGRKLRGLMLDANPDATREAQWHAEANHLTEVFAINGLVGEGASGAAAEFFLYESNICSTSHLTETMRQRLKGKWTKISVPCVSIETNWRQRFGDTRCHLLKIDVEGSEMNFLRAERSFLSLVDSVLIEWHAWGATKEDIKKYLGESGFAFVKTVEEGENMGTDFFRRTPDAK